MAVQSGSDASCSLSKSLSRAPSWDLNYSKTKASAVYRKAGAIPPTLDTFVINLVALWPP